MPTQRELEYRAYLRSKEWKAFRNKIIKKRGKICQACNLPTPLRTLHCHHITYVRFGRELQKDVVLLCKHCHRTVHKIFRQTGQKDLALVTERVIEYMQKLSALHFLDKS